MFALMLTVVPHYLIQIMVMSTLTGILFSYAMFFLTRVFMIQILAVLAPLAILASVLPRTSRHFKTWMDWLIGWSLGGILMLFLLTLGLSSSKMIMPANIQYTPLTFSTYIISTITNWHFYWIALAIYMLAVETICSGLIPQLSGKISDATTKGMSGLGKGFSGNKKNPGFKEGINQRVDNTINRAGEEYRSAQVPTNDLRSQ
jgi:hypothetical protein